MYLNPTIGASLAEQHRRDLMSQASAARLTRAARQGRPRHPARRPLIVGAFRVAAAAAALAAAAFLVTPAGPSHAPSANGKWGVHSWEHRFVNVSHSLVLADRSGGNIRFAGHRFAGHRFSSRWA